MWCDDINFGRWIAFFLIGVFILGIVGYFIEPGAALSADSISEECREAGVYNVKIQRCKITPSIIRINKGDVVVWVNVDFKANTVTFSNTGAGSGPLESKEVYSRVFTKSGTYEYYSKFNPCIQGKVIVR